jgi:hypothetical protein
VVDMSAAAVTARLREMARLLAVRGRVDKGVDMSPRQLTARIQTLGARSDMCRRLVKVGEPLRAADFRSLRGSRGKG